MANEPKKRHSKPSRPAVTIDLEPSHVGKAETDENREAAATEPGEGEAKSAPETPATGQEAESAEEKRTGAGERSADQGETAEPRRRSPLPAAIGGGIVGAIVALAGGAALQWNGMIPVPDTGIAALRQELADLKNNPPQQAAEGQDTRAAIVSAQEAANSALSRADAASAAAAQIKDEVSTVQKAVKALEAKAPPVDSAALKALDGRVANVEQKLSNLPAAPESGDLKAATDALSGRLDALGTRLDAAAAKADSAASSASGNADAIASLKSDMEGIKKQLAASAGQPKIARAIAAAALKSAIDRGGPFATELQTFASVAPKSAALASLDKLAGKGVATIGELQAEFPAVADRIVAATTPVDKKAGFFGQLVDSARSLVKVRPVGMVAGNGPDAIVARMGAALKAGDIDRVLKEWSSLPEAGKKASQDFADRMRARQEADKAVAAALSQAIKPGSDAGQSE